MPPNGVICKLSEGDFCLLLQVIDQLLNWISLGTDPLETSFVTSHSRSWTDGEPIHFGQ